MELRAITPLKDLGGRQRDDNWLEPELFEFLHVEVPQLIFLFRALGSDWQTFPSESERE